MKAKYIKLSEVPKRRYTKWISLIEEFVRSDAEAIEIDPELERTTGIYQTAGNIRRSIKKLHYAVDCSVRGNRIYLVKS